MPDRKLFMPEQKLLMPEGKLLVPEQELLMPEGKLLVPEEELLMPEGKLGMPEGEVLWMIATPSCYSGLLGFNPFGVLADGLFVLFVLKQKEPKSSRL